ncbi:MAG: DUF3253 domain-containing protein [Pseudomonadota bacterium]
MAGPLSETILEMVAACGPSQSITTDEIARAYQAAIAKPKDKPHAWRRFIRPAREEAIGLARAGRLVILRKGKQVDPKAPIKGVIRVAPFTPGDIAPD